MDKLSYAVRPLQVIINDKYHYIATRLEYQEGISEANELVIKLITQENLASNLLGKIIVANFHVEGRQRYFSGLMTQINFDFFQKDKRQYFFEIKAVDPISFISYGSKRHVYQMMTSKDIIDSVLSASDMAQYFTFSLSSKGFKHEYCCQLDESDGQFIRRICASEGWFYYQDNSSKKLKIIISDKMHSLPDFEYKSLHYVKSKSNYSSNVISWSLKNLFNIEQVMFENYMPLHNSAAFSQSGHSTSSIQSEFYGQGIIEKRTANETAKFQLEAQQVVNNKIQAESSVIGLAAAVCFNLQDNPINSDNERYYISHIEHEIQCEESGSQIQYLNRFDCHQKAKTFRPVYITKPHCYGLQSGIVVGPEGKEIHRDKYGRIQVRLLWENNTQQQNNNACWLMVLQPFASKGFGLQFLPRVGDHVFVQFINGDPDQPIVIGSFYNELHLLPFSSASCSGLKTKTTPNGQSNQGNELSFEDNKDNELIRIFAQKDLSIQTNNDYQAAIKGEHNTEVDKSLTIMAKEQITIKSDKTQSLKSLDNMLIASDKDIKINADSDINIKASKKTKIDANSIFLTATQGIELKVGASKIVISSSSVSIESPQILINGSAKAQIKSALLQLSGQAKAELNGAIVSVSGQAMSEIKAGALVQINGAITKIN